jgi:predicted nucleotidyltransferase
MAKKPVTKAERLVIQYNNNHREFLKKIRLKTIQIMETLDNSNLKSIVHGSVARGDVSKTSDIDIFLPNPPSSFIIETILERSGFKTNQRTIIQATPTYALKGYITLNHYTSISFPLVKLRPVEREFYRFSGQISLDLIKKNERTLGVDKRLMLIEPTKEGHIESAIVGQEKEISTLLKISLNTVLDRIGALKRRDKIGRTGVFLKKELGSNETFEQVLKKLADQNPAIRRRINFYQK